MKKPEQTMKLSEVQGMLRVIATAMLKQHGVYYCMVEGKRTQIVEG